MRNFSKRQAPFSGKCFWKCRLQNDDDFCLGLTVIMNCPSRLWKRWLNIEMMMSWHENAELLALREGNPLVQSFSKSTTRSFDQKLSSCWWRHCNYMTSLRLHILQLLAGGEIIICLGHQLRNFCATDIFLCTEWNVTLFCLMAHVRGGGGGGILLWKCRIRHYD